MRVLVFEYVTGGGFAGRDMVPSLLSEGELMLSAVVQDLLEIKGVEVSICRDSRLGLPYLPVHVEWVEREWFDGWRACLPHVDAVLPIAPETNGILEALCLEVEAAGKILLNSRPDAVALTASKCMTSRILGQVGVPVVSCWAADEAPEWNGETMVVKPDAGVGCQGIRLIRDRVALKEFLGHQERASDWMVQPYLSGVAASLSLLVGGDCVCLLGSNRQRVAQINDDFVFLGCVVNGLIQSAPELLPLAQRLCEAIPGLWGYVGVDLMLTEKGPVVLEVNPRLTTSYAGLSRSIGCNVAALMLQLASNPAALPGHFLQGTSVHVDLELGRVA
jgi:predicted ATP-grasp superfamily ATP-dependent carboligase